MATFKELRADWVYVKNGIPNFSLADLQLAAELGKTLLERNKELETNLRQQQNVVDDRNQEIEYLTKQTAALREVNDSRLRIYEQLEISIQDLERNNQRLVQENINDKKQIKSLYETIESLESRCEDLQHLVDDMGHLKKDDSVVPEGSVSGSAIEDQDEYAKLVSQLEHAKNQRAKEQRKVSELEQNVSLLIKENTNLEEKVIVMQQKDEELKTLQDQIVYLEEIRQGNLCRRCQRTTDQNLFDEYSVYDDDDDTDDISAIGSYVETHKHEVLQQLQETLGENYSEDNPYRILVDKYEALLKIQQKHNAFTTMLPSNNCKDENQGISLHEELQMSGQFSSFNGNASDSDDDDGGDATTDVGGGGVATARGPACKYSETETTSSSGFSDETSNKCTQTETFFTGSFLCTISDGDDCRFSIYDDASPIESRFRKTPEYRQLFREIFAVLKRAAEAKDEGERLPLLQDEKCDDLLLRDNAECDDDDDGVCDSRRTAAAPRVPPATPACETNPLIGLLETAAAARCEPVAATEQHIPMAAERRVEKCERAVVAAAADREQPRQDDRLGHTVRQHRDIIEELASCSAKHKKHVRHRKHPSSGRQQSRDISHLVDYKWKDTSRQRSATGGGGSGDRPSPSHRATWYGPRDETTAGHESMEFKSIASQEVAKLKLLEKSYAEVLRVRKPPSNRPQTQYFG
ncbi:uncharacterized protein LOC112684111 isoform X2 [Sipha flava]|uniref:Uncharacterized protein LOC112684111 isoform X2 n=1 Tax=Sipha flava TaxID=143950 RepID=A0A8B8FKS2_9HEMI|nr:uncharacterized protein LOC112684111 isoform X2 [Sipha flava]